MRRKKKLTSWAMGGYIKIVNGKKLYIFKKIGIKKTLPSVHTKRRVGLWRP
jgi:hypothetical protein